MQVTSQQAEKLLCGNYSFSQLGFSMMMTRLKTVYAKEPSQAALQKSMGEINAFLEKFKGIMSNDFATIANL